MDWTSDDLIKILLCGHMNTTKNKIVQMLSKTRKCLLVIGWCLIGLLCDSNAQTSPFTYQALNSREQHIISIAALTAKGDLERLNGILHAGLDAGLTVNEIKEVLVHLYAYCGFPRSIRGLQTFMEVVKQRKEKGVNDILGKDASPIEQGSNKYQRGKNTLSALTKTPQPANPSGYGAFAPIVDTLLKEHLFADLFDRDVLTYAERELVTISVIATIGRAEPMLRSHLDISLNLGLTEKQLYEFVEIINETSGRKAAKAARSVLKNVLSARSSK